MPSDGVSPWDPMRDLADTEAILQGHFQLTGGLHADRFLLLPRLVAHPARLAPWLDALAPAARAAGAEAIGGPAMGAVALAWGLASRLGPEVVALYAEKTEDGGMAVKRGFGSLARRRVFLVEDAMTTGGSLLKAQAAFEAVGSSVVGVGVLVDRRREAAPFGVPVSAVLSMPLDSWDPAHCPLCAEGRLPLVKPKQLA
jgi:orotate phosphoribosyltransferase